MKKAVFVCVLLLVSAGTAWGNHISVTAPEGDGSSGKARYGTFSGWENTGFSATVSPNSCYYWYDYDANGAWQNVYLQIALPAVADVDLISSVTLNLNITGTQGAGARLYHRTNASTATGLASQQLTGDLLIGQITGPLGWLAIDVTDPIKADLTAGYDWAVFHFAYAGSSSAWSSLSFSSGETAEAAYLNIVPEPSACIMLVAGALCLLPRPRPRK